LDTVPAERRRLAVNVVGILAGHPAASGPDSIVLVDAHYDHLGMARTPVNGDSVYNGADDDASGTVAVLEIARIMKSWPTPSRTVVFLATTGEESGLVGTGWYLANPVRPLSTMAANLEIEMIGRPDTIATGRGRAWLTGFERSTMGESFQRADLPIMADMRPSESFFSRSDNIAFAQAGIPAHTLSSFNLHTDYHGLGDDVSKIDFGHMAALINTGARAVWVLTEGPAPMWNRGGRPCPAGPRLPRPQLTPAQQDSARAAAQFPQSCAR
jgi:Zn-dependent M28 family amino/carboxypeptidase